MNLKMAVRRKQSTPNFPKNDYFLPSHPQTCVCLSGGTKCLFFGKFGVLSCNNHFQICRFALLPTNFHNSIYYGLPQKKLIENPGFSKTSSKVTSNGSDIITISNLRIPDKLTFDDQISWFTTGKSSLQTN